MANHQELLDAITRVGARTGDPGAWMAGLSAADIATAMNPASPPAAIDGVLARIRAAHTDVFAGPPSQPTGDAVEAIRAAETALAQQNSLVAQVDLQVVTAVLNAHAARADGVAALDRLQQEIEGAVNSRTDLDTAVGARAFQRYLIDKLRDIRAVLEDAGLDATSKASLTAALASLYAADGVGEDPPPPEMPMRPTESDSAGPAVEPVPVGTADLWPGDLGLPEIPAIGGEDVTGPPPAEPGGPEPAPPPAPAAPPLAAVPAPAMPSWGGLPGVGPPSGGGLPTLPSLTSLADPGFEPDQQIEGERPTDPDPPADAEPIDSPDPVELPNGETLDPKLATVISAAVAGMPIPDAFGHQGIAIPAPGSPIAAQVAPDRVMAGDIGIYADRHALALGNGKALLDQQIAPIASVGGPGFLGWLHPPPSERNETTTATADPAPSPPPATDQ